MALNPQSWNLYSYVRNNPLSFVDPSGESACPVFAECWTDENGNVWYKDPSTGEDTLYLGEADSGVPDPNGSIKHPDGSRTMTNDEATGQQRERRDEFFLNNIFAGAGHVLGRIINGFGKIHWGINPFKSTPKPQIVTAAVPAAAPSQAATQIAAVNALDRNGLTWIGRAIQKHANRVGSAFRTSARNPAGYNKSGEAVAKEILENPASIRTPNRRGGINVRHPDGRGISFNSDGTPYSLLEP